MPDKNRCSVCSTTVKPFKFESRPTGSHGEMQRWPYCARCWEECVASRQEFCGCEAEDEVPELVEMF